MRRALLIAAMALGSALPQALAQTEAKSEAAATVLSLLESSGYRYTKVSASTWRITFKGKQLPSVPVLVIAKTDRMVVRAVVAGKDEAVNPTEVMRALLRMNADLSGAGLLIDENNDYVAEARPPLQIDTAGFKACLSAVARAADSAYGAVQPHLVPAKGLAAGPSTPAFSVPAGASRTVELLAGASTLSFNPALWTEKESSDKGKRLFRHAKGDGYAVVVVNPGVELTLAALREVALTNARKASPDLNLVAEGHRRVNGRDMLMLRTEGTVEGMALAWFGYYVCTPGGTIQVVTYAGRNQFEEYARDFEDLLNGIRTTTTK